MVFDYFPFPVHDMQRNTVEILEEIDPDYAIEDNGCDYCYDCAEELGLIEEEDDEDDLP